MSTANKLLTMAFGIALVTTLILPKRQTPGVIGAVTGGLRGIMATAMGTGRAV